MFIVVGVELQESSMIDHNHHAIKLQLELTKGVTWLIHGQCSHVH
jgi:hypothetical protein